MPDADRETRALLRKLASDASLVYVHEHAQGNMMAWNLTKDDVLEGICEALDNGDRVKRTTLKALPPNMVGEPAYEIKPVCNGMRWYVRMAVFKPSEAESLLLISVHVDS